MRIVIDADRCIGSGMCASVAPGVFDLGDDCKAVAVAESPDESQRSAVESAVMCCPVDAISLLDG